MMHRPIPLAASERERKKDALDEIEIYISQPYVGIDSLSGNASLASFIVSRLVFFPLRHATKERSHNTKNENHRSRRKGSIKHLVK